MPAGRWINRDPLGEDADINLYTFNFNDPINYIDPDGQQGTYVPSFPIDKIITLPKFPVLGGGAAAAALPAVGAGVVGGGLGYLAGTGIDEYFGISDWWGPRIGNWICPIPDTASMGKNKSRKSGKERGSDTPSWAKGTKPDPTKKPKDQAKDIMDTQYPEGWKGGPGSEYNKIKKFLERNK